ncbi:MAG: nitrile hydratase subunit alpha [Deltaproteobacteria bacterium]|nr:nitrile hydratase subunit alpha [Deltaproteobacteria bacterium]MDZ4346980.1 nitrile hydratase subunit alpha [Candidatus Binatia bacterium]
MSGKHGHKPFEGHMHDFEAHIRAVEEDLEYYRAKRFEPRIFYLIRRGVVTFSDLLNARVALKRRNQFFKPRKPQGKNIEARVRYLEEWLDEYVKGIALVSARAVEAMDMVTEDNRKERGDYDDFFKFKKKEHKGTLKQRMANLEQDLKDYQELIEVFVQALIKRGWSTRRELKESWKQLHEERPWAGGVIVAKAWANPAFKRALLSTGREALREMGVHQGKVGKLVVVENTDKVHNVVVCTLCSCYPYDILGDTPWWYKHESYRTNIVQNPRACVKEMFQLEIPAAKEVQVYDSTSDVRYFVLPQRPAGTEGMSEEELAKLVTVDSLIGAGYALEPSQQKQAMKLGAAPESPRVRPD